MGRNNNDFRSAQIANSQHVSHAIRQGWIKPVDRSEIDRLSKVALNKILKDR